MKIYRVEKENGEGPFMYFGEHMNRGLPGPDFELGFPVDFRVDFQIFGCKNKKLMRQWIVNAEKLKKVGFVVNEYSVPKASVFSGFYQSVFFDFDATLITTHDIVRFKKNKL